MYAIARHLPVALLIGIALGVAIGAGGLAIVAAQAPQTSTPSATPEAEVRITARLLKNGKVEFGLQQREGDGWGPRQLPRVRYVPADAQVGRWLNSSPLAVTWAPGAAAATAPQPGPAATTGTWQRDRWDDWIRGYTLTGTGAYGATGPADSGHGAFPELALSCLWIGNVENSPGDWGADVQLRASQIHLVDHDQGGRLRYWIAGGPTNYGDATIVTYTKPFVSVGDFAFMDWLSVNYRRNRTVHLDAYASDGALYFTSTFDLTGLPAVLADLPCFGVGE